MNDPSAPDFPCSHGLSPTSSTAHRLFDALVEDVRGRRDRRCCLRWNAPAPGRSKFTSSTRRTRTRCGRSLAISPATRCAIAWCLPPVAARDWVAQSLEGLAPVCGRAVCGPRRARPAHRIAPNRIGVEIEAALAFGTGHHGTTLGCLMALDRMLNRRRPRAAFSDASAAGPACLPSAAARATRRPVVASDIDPVSVRVARHNARSQPR